MMDQSQPPSDNLILPFQVGESAVRGRLVRLGSTVDEILSRHPFPVPVLSLLGELGALVSMLGASLKFDGKIIVQAQGDGPLRMMVADFTADGALRVTGGLPDDHVAAAAKAQGPELHYLLRKGHMVITIDQGPDMDRYQGVVPLEGATMAKAAVNYFAQSEQIPTAIVLAAGRYTGPTGEETWRAGGIMVQFMPGEGGTRERGEEVVLAADDRELWNRAATLLETAKPDELLDPTLSPEQLLYRLYHEDGVRVFDAMETRKGCSCSQAKIVNVLAQYPEETLREMMKDGAITVSCDYCRIDYRFVLDDEGAFVAG